MEPQLGKGRCPLFTSPTPMSLARFCATPASAEQAKQARRHLGATKSTFGTTGGTGTAANPHLVSPVQAEAAKHSRCTRYDSLSTPSFYFQRLALCHIHSQSASPPIRLGLLDLKRDSFGATTLTSAATVLLGNLSVLLAEDQPTI